MNLDRVAGAMLCLLASCGGEATGVDAAVDPDAGACDWRLGDEVSSEGGAVFPSIAMRGAELGIAVEASGAPGTAPVTRLFRGVPPVEVAVIDDAEAPRLTATDSGFAVTYLRGIETFQARIFARHLGETLGTETAVTPAGVARTHASVMFGADLFLTYLDYSEDLSSVGCLTSSTGWGCHGRVSIATWRPADGSTSEPVRLSEPLLYYDEAPRSVASVIADGMPASVWAMTPEAGASLALGRADGTVNVLSTIVDWHAVGAANGTSGRVAVAWPSTATSVTLADWEPGAGIVGAHELELDGDDRLAVGISGDVVAVSGGTTMGTRVLIMDGGTTTSIALPGAVMETAPIQIIAGESGFWTAWTEWDGMSDHSAHVAPIVCD